MFSDVPENFSFHFFKGQRQVSYLKEKDNILGLKKDENDIRIEK